MIRDPNQDPFEYRQEQAVIAELRRRNRLTGEELNRLFAKDYLARHRYKVNPDSALTVLFCLDSVLVDVSVYAQDIWKNIAEITNMKIPSKEAVRRYIDRPPETLVNGILDWGLVPSDVRRLSNAYDDTLLDGLNRTESIDIESGAPQLLSTAFNAGLTLGAYTSMTSPQAELLLQRSSLNRVISAVSTREEGLGAMKLLELSVKLRKPPVLTAVLTDNPRDIMHAKQAGMKVIAVPGAYYGYELRAADILLPSLSDIRIVTIKRMFDLGDLRKYEQGFVRPLYPHELKPMLEGVREVPPRKKRLSVDLLDPNEEEESNYENDEFNKAFDTIDGQDFETDYTAQYRSATEDAADKRAIEQSHSKAAAPGSESPSADLSSKTLADEPPVLLDGLYPADDDELNDFSPLKASQGELQPPSSGLYEDEGLFSNNDGDDDDTNGISRDK